MAMARFAFRLRATLLALALCSLCAVAARAAAPVFPALSGRVVDEAGLLDRREEEALAAALERHEAQTGNQVVVATLKSLQGYSIEDYGYRLGRAWGIGQKEKDNGALLLVAPNEREVRIEVGYGLEGTLTDALSHLIIARVILPHFKSGDYEGGILQGTAAILSALEGRDVTIDGQSAPVSALSSHAKEPPGALAMLALFFMFFLLSRLFRRHGLAAPLILGGMMGSRGYRGGGFGGFGGGGGSFGGGGASGRW